MIAIRTDANEHIAMGHLMRCLTIAEALRQKGENIIFFMADEYSVEFVKNKGYEVVVLNSSYNELEQETEKLCNLLKQYKMQVLLVDTYYVTYNYLKALSSEIKVAYLDDVAAFEYPVDMVINYAPYYEKLGYRSRSEILSENDCLPNTEYILGADYIPIRQEFITWRDKASNKAHRGGERMTTNHAINILITTGGADAFNVAGRLLKMWSRKYSDTFMQYNFKVVSGKFNQHLNELQEMCQINSNIELIVQADNMAELMASSDIAVTAAGTTMYELCAMGVPAVSVIMADNQKLCAEYFDEKDLIVNCGLAQSDDTLELVIKHINELAVDGQRRQHIVQKMKKYIDGRGAERLAQKLSCK